MLPHSPNWIGGWIGKGGMDGKEGREARGGKGRSCTLINILSEFKPLILLLLTFVYIEFFNLKFMIGWLFYN